jgi:hypothetical protein
VGLDCIIGTGEAVREASTIPAMLREKRGLWDMSGR